MLSTWLVALPVIGYVEHDCQFWTSFLNETSWTHGAVLTPHISLEWHIDNLFDIYRHTLVIAVFACIYNTVLYKTIQNDCQVGAEQQCPLEETTTSIWRTPQWFTVVQLQTSYSQNTISFVRGIKKTSQALIFCHRKGTEQRFLYIVVLPIRPRQVHCG